MKIFRVAAAVLTAVALSIGNIAPASANQILKLGVSVKPVSLAADQAQYGDYVWFYQSVYDGLLRKSENGTVVPGLASSWSYNANQTRLTLQLRSGVRFTDGTAFDAAGVVRNLQANKSSKGPMANYLDTMRTAVAQGSSTVIINLTESNPSFLGYLADTAGLMASPKTIGRASARTNPIGTGPYILNTARTVAGSKYIYTSNPNYWDRANRKFTGLQINVYENSQPALVNALRSGAIMGAGVADVAAAQTLVSAGYKNVTSSLDARGIYFADRGGNRKSCIADVNVRRAINSVFDRPGIVASIASGAGRATTQFIPSTMPGFDSALDRQYAFSEIAAQRLMAQSAFANGCTITMPTAPGFFGEATYAIIKAQLAKLKITVTEEAATANFFGDLAANKYDAFYMQFERSGDPWTLINFMIAPTAMFPGDKYSTPQMDKLIADYKVADPAARTAILKRINGILVKDAWFNIWYEVQSNFLYKGFTVDRAQAGNGTPFLYNIIN